MYIILVEFISLEHQPDELHLKTVKTQKTYYYILHCFLSVKNEYNAI